VCEWIIKSCSKIQLVYSSTTSPTINNSNIGGHKPHKHLQKYFFEKLLWHYLIVFDLSNWPKLLNFQQHSSRWFHLSFLSFFGLHYFHQQMDCLLAIRFRGNDAQPCVEGPPNEAGVGEMMLSIFPQSSKFIANTLQSKRCWLVLPDPCFLVFSSKIICGVNDFNEYHQNDQKMQRI